MDNELYTLITKKQRIISDHNLMVGRLDRTIVERPLQEDLCPALVTGLSMMNVELSVFLTITVVINQELTGIRAHTILTTAEPLCTSAIVAQDVSSRGFFFPVGSVSIYHVILWKKSGIIHITNVTT